MTISADSATPPAAAGRPVPDDPATASRRAPALPPDERRAAIIDAAIPLLRQSGRRVTTREIADAAGIAEGTIFRVFDTKDDLIHAVIEHVLDVSETVDAILAIDGLLPLPEKVRHCVTILATRLKSVFEIMMALHPRGPDSQKADQPGTTKPKNHAHGPNDQRQAQLLNAIATLFEPDVTRLTCSPHRAASLLRILAFSGAHPMIAGNEHLTADEITDVLLHGIGRPDRLAEEGVIPATAARGINRPES
jgi:AcrR family transcriptional regulator